MMTLIFLPEELMSSADSALENQVFISITSKFFLFISKQKYPRKS